MALTVRVNHKEHHYNDAVIITRPDVVIIIVNDVFSTLVSRHTDQLLVDDVAVGLLLNFFLDCYY